MALSVLRAVSKEAELEPTLQGTSAFSPARQQFRNVRPTVSQQAVRLAHNAVLLQSPAALFYCWVQVVVPALAALLPISGVQVFGNERPALSAIPLNKLCDLHRKCHCMSVKTFLAIF